MVIDFETKTSDKEKNTILVEADRIVKKSVLKLRMFKKEK